MGFKFGPLITTLLTKLQKIKNINKIIIPFLKNVKFQNYSFFSM